VRWAKWSHFGKVQPVGKRCRETVAGKDVRKVPSVAFFRLALFVFIMCQRVAGDTKAWQLYIFTSASRGFTCKSASRWPFSA